MSGNLTVVGSFWSLTHHSISRENWIFFSVSLQLWSSKWSIKDEHKLLSELGGGGGGGGGGGTGTTGGNGPSSGGGGGGGNGGGNGGGGGGYYEHSGFPGNAIATSAELYDSLGTISTMTQAQTPHLYTPPIGGTIGEQISPSLFSSLVLFQPSVQECSHFLFFPFSLLFSLVCCVLVRPQLPIILQDLLSLLISPSLPYTL